MFEFTKKELVYLLTQNTQQQPKAKYSNAIILRMLDTLPNNFVASVEITRGGFMLNRGSLVECIIKAVVSGDMNSKKSEKEASDLDTTNLDKNHLELVNNIVSTNIEIKFSTSFAPATKKTNKARKTIIVGDSGIYMIDSRNIVTTKAGKINLNNQHIKDLTPLTKLMDLLGFNA